MYFLLPIGLLVWNLMIERLSPTRSIFWAALFLIIIVLTQRPLLAWLRGNRSNLGTPLRQGVEELRTGLINGARSMLAVAIATATAGIIVGTVTLTGIGLVMAELVEVTADRPAPEWMFILALALIAWVVMRQRRRRDLALLQAS